MTKTFNIQEVWQHVSSAIKADFSETCYYAWFTGVAPHGIENNVFKLSAPNQIKATALKNMFASKIKSALWHVTGVEFEIEIIANAQIEPSKITVLPPKKDIKAEAKVPKEEKYNYPAELNPLKNFDNFITGENNSYAKNCALSICKNLGKYNPVLFYGGSGLGKTHLLHAIGHKILEDNPKAKLLYINSEKFTNEFISTLNTKNMNAFRNKFRNLDVLLLDDLQFFMKKERVQEEFFHTFNDLKNANKQIVLVADRPIKEMSELVDRLRSRISGGLIVEIQPPDFDTRVAILKQNLAKSGAEAIDDEVVSWIAEHIKNNIRELEGAVLKVTSHAEISQTNIDLKLATKVLNDYLTDLSHTCCTTIDIIKAVEEHFNLIKGSLTSQQRTRAISNSRHIAMFLCRELTESTLPEIGETFGGRDHTSVLHAVNKIKKEMQHNLEIITTINSIKEKLA